MIDVLSLSIAVPSFRLYRVRPSQPHDHPALANGAVSARQCITIVRLIDGAVMIPPAAWPWHDTDEWAGNRWRQAERERREPRSGVRGVA